jgi:hypothetical protein
VNGALLVARVSSASKGIHERGRSASKGINKRARSASMGRRLVPLLALRAGDATR